MRSGLISSTASSAKKTPARLSAIGYRSARPRRCKVKFVPRKANLSIHGRMASRTREPDSATPLMPKGKPIAKLATMIGEMISQEFEKLLRLPPTHK